MNIKNTQIDGLYKLKRSDYEKFYMTLISAFRKYPKMLNAFPDDETPIKSFIQKLKDFFKKK